MYAFTHFSLSFVIHPLSASSTQAGVNDHEQPQQPMVTWEDNISCCWVHLSYLALLFSYPSLMQTQFFILHLYLSMRVSVFMWGPLPDSSFVLREERTLWGHRPQQSLLIGCLLSLQTQVVLLVRFVLITWSYPLSSAPASFMNTLFYVLLVSCVCSKK